LFTHLSIRRLAGLRGVGQRQADPRADAFELREMERRPVRRPLDLRAGEGAEQSFSV
jgi:hypothetical protein